VVAFVVLTLLVSLPSIAAETNPSGKFAPLAADHELAAIWNDADFHRRLIGSYGFASEAEPRLQPDELEKYRTVVVPVLTNSDPKKIIATIEGLTGPKASAVFDFTLGNVYFQREDLTNAVKCFETAILKFPDYRRAQKNLAFALVRDGKYAEAIKPLYAHHCLGRCATEKFLGCWASLR
jgi:tetratricopeptide (TPR) repeat protein